MTHLAAAVIVAVPFTIRVTGVAYIMTSSQYSRMGLSTETTVSLFLITAFNLTVIVPLP
jgi:hypothetical protein